MKANKKLFFAELFFAALAILVFTASATTPFLHAADDAASNATSNATSNAASNATSNTASNAAFERLTIVSTSFQERGILVSFSIKIKNTGTVNFENANASANLGGEKAETQFFNLPRGAVKEIVFSFSKPSIPGTYKGMIVVIAGKNELRQPIELTVESPPTTFIPTTSGLEQYLIPALAALALVAIALVLLAKRGKRKPLERGLLETPVKYYKKK